MVERVCGARKDELFESGGTEVEHHLGHAQNKVAAMISDDPRLSIIRVEIDQGLGCNIGDRSRRMYGWTTLGNGTPL